MHAHYLRYTRRNTEMSAPGAEGPTLTHIMYECPCPSEANFSFFVNTNTIPHRLWEIRLSENALRSQLVTLDEAQQVASQ